MPNEKQPKYVKFEFFTTSASGKTKIWEVRTTENYLILGYVEWFGSWRRYAFFPEPKSIFEWTCMRDIADFCESRTKEHKEAGKVFF